MPGHCCKCGRKVTFSANQMKKLAAIRRCSDCVKADQNDHEPRLFASDGSRLDEPVQTPAGVYCDNNFQASAAPKRSAASPARPRPAAAAKRARADQEFVDLLDDEAQIAPAPMDTEGAPSSTTRRRRLDYASEQEPMSAATVPTELVGLSGQAASRMPPPDASLHVVASYLCDRAHEFPAEGGAEDDLPALEDDLLPGRALEWRTAVEARLGAAANLKPNQAECMAAQLLGIDTVHLAPTGSGKSLCFLADALAGARLGLSVVVSPLQSLIRSQSEIVNAWLLAVGGGGHAMHELTDFVAAGDEEQADAGDQHLDSLEQALMHGTLAWSIVHDASLRVAYLTPEKLASPCIASALASVAVAQYVVDEAHCLTDVKDWRPEYDKVGSRLNSIDARREAAHAAQGRPPPRRPSRHACTATASADDLDEIERVLAMRRPHRIVCEPNAFTRPNLHLMVLHADPKVEALYHDVTHVAARAACAALHRFYAVSPAFDDAQGGGSGIVYVRWAADAKPVAKAISTQFKATGVRAMPYVGTSNAQTADEAAALRDANAAALAAFDAGEVQWLVATCSLGMGIDFAREVRAVIHIGFPPSADDYQQEIGRGGRKGGRCDCVLYASLPMVHRTVVLLCKDAPGEARHQVARRLERFEELLGVLLSEGCRREALLGAVLGPELACRCDPCTTCDRCCEGQCCEVTGAEESTCDLSNVAATLHRRLGRRAQPVLRCSDRELWGELDAPVKSAAGCTQLVLLMLARRLLRFEPDSATGALVCARGDQQAVVASMRQASLCTDRAGGKPLATAGEHALLERLLSELEVMELQMERQQSELDRFRCRCSKLAVRLGRVDLISSVQCCASP